MSAANCGTILGPHFIEKENDQLTFGLTIRIFVEPV